MCENHGPMITSPNIFAGLMFAVCTLPTVRGLWSAWGLHRPRLTAPSSTIESLDSVLSESLVTRTTVEEEEESSGAVSRPGLKAFHSTEAGFLMLR